MRRRLRTGVLVAALGAHLAIAATGVAVLADLAPRLSRATGTGGAQSAAPGLAQAAPACRVRFTPRDRWNTGFTADLVVTNTGPRIEGWVLSYNAGPGVRVVHGWNGIWSQRGQQVSVRNNNWNATLETGRSVNAGLSAAFDRVNPAPSGFALNGVACA